MSASGKIGKNALRDRVNSGCCTAQQRIQALRLCLPTANMILLTFCGCYFNTFEIGKWMQDVAIFSSPMFTFKLHLKITPVWRVK
jgi:hypothetical protein